MTLDKAAGLHAITPTASEKGHDQFIEDNTAQPSVTQNLSYDNDEEEPVLHWRTWVALAALWMLNYVQVFALTGPPAVLSYLGESVTDGSVQEKWVPNVLSLVQAVAGPIIAFASDSFQSRKLILLATCTCSFVGSAIAPGAENIYRVIGAQVLIGVGFASVPLAYCIPSEIIPRRWRPLAQASVQFAANAAGVTAPIIAGAFTKYSLLDGWRKFYWVEMGLWGATVAGIAVAYRPPRRRSQLDDASLSGKIKKLDVPGMLLLAAGLTLLLTGLGLGANPYPWSSGRVVGTLASGCATLVAFGIYEWKVNPIGIFHHALFTGSWRIFPLLLALMFIEGVMLFTVIIFYPVITGVLFEPDPLLQTVRQAPFQTAAMCSSVIYGIWASKYRTLRWPLFAGFVFFTAGLVGMATVQLNTSTSFVVFNGLAGLGFGAPLVLIISGAQLATPQSLIATGTAVITSTRAVAAAVFTAIYAAAVNTRSATYVPTYVAEAAVSAGLPRSSVGAFVEALATKNNAELAAIPGINPSIIGAGVKALLQALADSFRVVYIIGAAFGGLACLICLLLGDQSATMNYHVDAPMEELTAKHREDIKA